MSSTEPRAVRNKIQAINVVSPVRINTAKRLSVRRVVRLFFFGMLLTGGAVYAVHAESKDGAWIEFIEAARMGDVPTVNRLLAEGVDVSRTDGSHFPVPALYHALDARQFEVARALIAAGADVKTMGGGDYPLTWAARAGDSESVRLMISKGANPNIRWEDTRPGYFGHGTLPMNTALAWGRVDVVKVLEKNGVSWLGDDRGAGALQLAVKSRNVACADYLLSHGADVNAQFEDTQALDLAAAQGNLPMMKLFLSRGADVNAVSRGTSPINQWGSYRRTALVSAVINSQLEAVRLLLSSGADAKALDSLAIKWADLLGDYESAALLRAGGAPDPGHFPYRDWLPLSGRGEAASLRSTRAGEAVLAPSLLASVSPETTLARDTKFAIINLGPGLDNAESLLAAKLSALPHAVVLEREQLQTLRKERSLDQHFGDSPTDNTRWGRLLGADALVILRSYPIEGSRVVEARIVSVATGLVAATVPHVLARDQLEGWSQRLADKCAASGAWLFTAPKAARLVAVSPFTASTNTPEARAMERQSAALLALSLAQTPGVFLVERSTLDLLQAEGGAEGRVLLDGSWLVGGSIELSLNDGGAALHLTLTPGGGGASHKVEVAGKASAPVGLAEAAMTRVTAILNTQPAQPWQPEAEAAAFLKQSEDFVARRMWTEAEESAHAARALGLREDRVARLLLVSACNRIDYSAYYYAAAKRKRYESGGAQELMTYRVPLLFPSDDNRDLGADEYLDQANLILDMLEPVLDRGESQIGGVPYSSWVCGQAWDSATQALKVTEALSYKNQYGDELEALRTRLLALNARALQIALDRNDAKTVHTLIAARCKNLPWWVQGDAGFQSEVRRLLRGAAGWAPPLSEHAVWGPVFEIAKATTRKTSGRASQSWIRLAEVMAQSEDVRERYWGSALLALETHNGPGMEKTVEAMKADFPALVELDQSIPARVWAIGYKPGPKPGEGGPFECWYAAVFYEVLNARSDLLEGGGNVKWTPMPNGPERLLPEFRRFYTTQCMRRLELVDQRGPSGYFLWFTGPEYLNADEFGKMTGLILRANARFETFTRSHPEVGDDIRGLASVADRCAKQLREAGADTRREAARLVLKTPRLLFAEQLARLGANQQARFRGMRDFHAFEAGGRRLFIANSWLPDTSVVFDFDAQGNLGDMIATPPVDASGVRLVMNPWGLDEVSRAGADMTTDYLATPGFGTNVKIQERGQGSVLVYDRAAKTWKLLSPPIACHLVFDVKIFSGKIYYTFIYNPTVAETGNGGSSDDLRKKGDPLSGVMEYDPATSRFNLLVSNRRTPAGSPLDAPGREYFSFSRVSADELEISGFPDDVYNARTGVWRTATLDDKTRVDALSPVRSYCVVNGIEWVPRYAKDGMVVFRNRWKSQQSVSLPITLRDEGIGELLAAYPNAREKYMRETKASYHWFDATPHGWAVWVGPVYYWLPMEQAKAALQKSLAETSEKGNAGAADAGH